MVTPSLNNACCTEVTHEESKNKTLLFTLPLSLFPHCAAVCVALTEKNGIFLESRKLAGELKVLLHFKESGFCMVLT